MALTLSFSNSTGAWAYRDIAHQSRVICQSEKCERDLAFVYQAVFGMLNLLVVSNVRLGIHRYLISVVTLLNGKHRLDGHEHDAMAARNK